MAPELDKKICEAFPKLYRKRGGDMKETCMCWGIATGDGWFQLIWDLSANLEALINNGHPSMYAEQVKSKYGTLRFYIGYGCDEAFKLIEKAELDSAAICEVCGKPGKIRPGGWIFTLCDECNKKG